MSVWMLPPDRATAAVEVLLEVFPDFPGSNRLSPGEERRIVGVLHERTLESGLAIGRVDAWGDPPVGVAVWLRRPALSSAYRALGIRSRRDLASAPRDSLPVEGAET